MAVVKVYNESLMNRTSRCEAARKAMGYLEKHHGADAMLEVYIALRYAKAMGDTETVDAFEIILKCCKTAN